MTKMKEPSTDGFMSDTKFRENGKGPATADGRELNKYLLIFAVPPLLSPVNSVPFAIVKQANPDVAGVIRGVLNGVGPR